MGVKRAARALLRPRNRTNIQSLVLALTVAVAAGLAGDGIYYWLGRRSGRKFLRPRFWISFELATCVRTAKKARTRFGARGLFVQRRLPMLGTLSAPLAGSFRMPVAKFLLVDSAGTVPWTSLLLGLGYAFSDHLERVARSVEHFELWFVAVCLASPVAKDQDEMATADVADLALDAALLVAPGWRAEGGVELPVRAEGDEPRRHRPPSLSRHSSGS